MKKKIIFLSLFLLTIGTVELWAQQNISIDVSGQDNIGWINTFGTLSGNAAPCWTGGATGTWTYSSNASAWVITGKNAVKPQYDSIVWHGIIASDCSAQIELNMAALENKYAKIRIRSTGSIAPAVVRFALLDNLGRSTNCDTCLAEITGLTNSFQDYFLEFDSKFHQQYGSYTGKIDSTKISAFMLTVDAGVATNNASVYQLEVEWVKIGYAATTSYRAPTRYSSSNISPNPTSNELNINLNLTKSSEIKIVLNDLMGRAVRTLEENVMVSNSFTKSYAVSDLEKGMYVLSFVSNNQLLKSELIVIQP